MIEASEAGDAIRLTDNDGDDVLIQRHIDGGFFMSGAPYGLDVTGEDALALIDWLKEGFK